MKRSDASKSNSSPQKGSQQRPKSRRTQGKSNENGGRTQCLSDWTVLRLPDTIDHSSTHRNRVTDRRSIDERKLCQN